MLDFTRIIAGVAGQRETFEEFVCQIARRTPPPGCAEFRRIHGAGGDGGVEAVWLLKAGGEVGYQAKYYTTSAGIDWAAIDGSVETAMATHPSLVIMHIAIACSLTGPTRRTTRAGAPATNGWTEWTKRKNCWTAKAKALGRSIDFVAWTAPDIEELLTRPAMVGLLDCWFGTIELTPSRLAAECQRTVDALEERYHPEDHVDVSTRSVFDGLLHNKALSESITAARAKLGETRQLGRRPGQLCSADLQRLDAIDAVSTQLIEQMARLPGPGDVMVYQSWETLALKLRTLLHEAMLVTSGLTERRNDDPPEKASLPIAKESADRTALDFHRAALRKLQNALSSVLETFASIACRADTTRFALLDGRAGSGKSHLIASEIERALLSGAPALFLIGTDFTLHGTPENQMLAHFEWSYASFDQLLGALSARAEAASTRGLVAIDALNEGAGAALWRETLRAFARRVLAFSNLSLCVSCRREYFAHLIMPSVVQMATTVELIGFETAAELERAARVYMDKRGIVRPATPWLNPEFSNPLFLRTTCLALHAERRTIFPRGMRGTSEVLDFYLMSTGRHLGTSYDGSDTLVDPLRSAVLGLAKFMANARRDSVVRADAHRLVERAFEGFAPPTGKTWLEVLRFRGLLRYDPDPGVDPSDPLARPADVVRFSFQRFGDHLVARELLEGAITPDGLFDSSGPLFFLIKPNRVVYEWSGLFYALFLHYADRYGVELVDHLPGGFDAWWNRWPVEDAFVESIRWRALTAFSDRTLELLNRLQRGLGDVAVILVELAVVEDHPWNSELLHRNLATRGLAERDAFWTVAINSAHDNLGHPLVRLIDWSLDAGIAQASNATLDLALVTLSWSCASTSARVRDTASKAILSIFVNRPSLAAPLFARFTGCNDPYVVERLFAALYGAGLRTLDHATLRAFANIAWKHCFEDAPPIHLLARDYARGIVELADLAGVRDRVIDLVRCRPPYGAAPPRFNVSEAHVELRAERLGAHLILGSCYKGIADFGRYILESRVQRFADARLSGPRPITSAEGEQAFYDEVATGRSDVAAAFAEVRGAYAARRMNFDHNTFKITIPLSDRRRIDRAAAALSTLLTPAQRRRYLAQTSGWASGSRGHAWTIPGRGEGKEINAQRCKVWVANRALSLGWSAKLFPNDRNSFGRSENGGRVERIGKKYQRIALMELLARLADNFWLKPQWENGAAVYNNPLDIEFTRDFEPSIMPADRESTTPNDVPCIPALVCEPLPVERRRDWVMDPDLPLNRLNLAVCVDLDTPDWLSLYRYAAHDIEADREDRTLDAPWLQSDFHFLTGMLAAPDFREQFAKDAIANSFDFHQWLPSQATDGPYIGELGRRDTWQNEPWTILQQHSQQQPHEYRVIRPVISYCWESHLDGSLPDGFSRYVPIPWLIRALSLRVDSDNGGIYRDAHGTPILVTGNAGGRNLAGHVLVRRKQYLAFARDNNLEPLWMVMGERRATTPPKKRHPDIRTRYNGMLWFEGDKAKRTVWSKDD